MDRALEYLLTISLFRAMYETISKFHNTFFVDLHVLYKLGDIQCLGRQEEVGR